ncbi:MAG TPA: response regulator transcription factor [Thermoanaerobaculia bacterium]|nr:response regulator transcription factor [Thermoanaerobaculia bacterium]
MSIRIVLADDHRIILEGLEQLFRRESDFEVLATCTDGEAALQAVRELSPDVLVLDVDMPRMDGITVLRQIHEEQIPTRVVLLTATVGDADVLEAMQLGAWGLVLKEAASVRLVQSVRMVQRGQRSLDQALVSRALEKVVRKSDGRDKLLSPRETDVVRMVAAGLRNKEIAHRLSISEGTVKSYLHAIYEKLEVHGRVELTLYAQDNGIL